MIAFWAAGLLAATTLTACGDDTTASGDGSDAADEVVITFWNTFTSSDRPAVEELVNRFNQAHAGQYKVDMTIQAGDVQAQKLMPAYQAGQGPTVVVVDASEVPGLASKGVIQAVDDAYGDGLDQSQLPKASLDATMWDGHQYGVPFSAASSMLYWNKTLFQEAGLSAAPTSMDQLVEYAQRLTKYEAGADTTNQYGFVVPDHAAVATWAVLLEAQGGSIVSDDRSRSTLGDAATIAAADFWVDAIVNHHISPVGLSGVDGDNLFNAGRAGMYINGPWATGGFDEAGIDYGIAPIPAGSATQTATAISTNMHLNAAASQAEKQAAHAFFQFWNSAESQTYWAIQTSYPPNTTAVTESAIAANQKAVAFSKAEGAKFYLGGLVNASKIDTDVIIPTIQRMTYGEGAPADLLPAAAQQIDGLLN
jgi:multiple sugar transport system substrate-binding protein